MPRPEVTLPADGLIAVVKRDCPTCGTGPRPCGAELAAALGGLTVYTQDDPAFPDEVAGRIDDTALNVSHVLNVEIVPTLIRRVDGSEADRTYGWDRANGNGSAAFRASAPALPAFRPGCGALNIQPGHD